ncbi:MAG: class I SAM-dependent methyltransferase [Patescibacteria group bacterium]
MKSSIKNPTQDILCPLCNSKSVKPASAINDDSFYFCDDCGAEFCVSIEAGSSEYYEFNYGADGEGYGDENKWEFQKFATDSKKFNVRGRLIDIGCGPGEFLKVASRCGFDVFGVDFNELAIEKARSCGFNNVKVGALSDIPRLFPGVVFDVASMFHVLEHLEDPALSIKEIKGILNSKGVLAIAVPNSRRFFLTINLRKRREGWDYPPHHLTRWNKDSLSKFLMSQGFEIMEIAEERLETIGQNYEFIQGFLSFLTSTGAVAKVKKDQFSNHEKQQKNTLKFRILKVAAVIKTVVLQVPVIILLPFLFLLSKFVFLRGVNLYVLAKKKIQ